MAAAGTRAGAAPDMAGFELVIGGMTCAACAARVQAKLNKLTGVTASVNLSTERACVIAPAQVSARDLVDVVEAAGYTAELAAPPEQDAAADATAAADEAAVRRLRRRLDLALVFFVPLTDLSCAVGVPVDPVSRLAVVAGRAGRAGGDLGRVAVPRRGAAAGPAPVLVDGHAGLAGHPGRLRLVGLRDVRAGPRAGRAQRPPGLLHGSGGGIYLEVAASVTTFLLAGRLYEARARRTAGQAMRDLAAAGAKDVCVLADDGTEHRMPAGRLRAGQRFVVRPGERIAADGEVLSGRSAVDRSMMTGESVPVDAAAGRRRDRRDHRADRPPGGPRRQGRPGHPARPPDRDGRAGPGGQGRHPAAGRPGLRRLRPGRAGLRGPDPGRLAAGRGPAGHAFSAALAVLIIACPCALGLATPAALVVASGRGAQLGIFIKGYQALESSRAIDTVVLDKTGTVTTGQMTVTGVQAVPGTSRAGLLRYAGSVEQASEHAVAAAITALARAEAPSRPRRNRLRPPAAHLAAAEGFTALAGLGARGVVDGREVIVGRARLLADQRAAASRRTWPPGAAPGSETGCTTVLAAWDGEVRGAFAVTDTVKPSAAAAVARLRAPGPAAGAADRRQRGHRARPWRTPPGSARSSARRCPRPRPG